mgnify:CR=1 FL=1
MYVLCPNFYFFLYLLGVSNLGVCLNLCHFFDHPYPIYALHSVVLVLLQLHSNFVTPFMDLQCSNWKIGLNVDDFLYI